MRQTRGFTRLREKEVLPNRNNIDSSPIEPKKKAGRKRKKEKRKKKKVDKHLGFEPSARR